MSLDRRELIIGQLVALMQSLVVPGGIKNVYRNQTTVSPTQRPAIVVLDADEEGTVGEFSLGRPGNSPRVLRMSPQINVLVAGPTLGSALNGFRVQIIQAVLNDPQLAIYAGDIGGIQYQGCVTDLGVGRTVEGLMVMNFEIHYPLLDADISS